MKDNISPEEKLLRLIRGSKKKDKHKQAKLKEQTPESTTKRIPSHKYFSFLYLKQFIKLAFLISCVYLVFSFVYPLLAPKKIKLPEVKQETLTEIEEKPITEMRPLEFYLSDVKNRSIFKGSTVYGSAFKPQDKSSRDLIKDLRLIGIISGDNPQAIIQDEGAGQTYYLNRGQMLGEFQIEDILEGKVILNHLGNKFELYL